MHDVRLQALINAMKSVLHGESSPIFLHEPSFRGREWEYVKECIDTGWVSSAGSFVERFERDVAAFTGAKHAIAVVNGTAALHICLKLAGVKQGDEVLVPTLTFIATANAVSYCGAIPHFVDSENATLGLDPVKLGQYLDDIAEVRANGCYNRHSGRCIRAVVPMHTFGHPVDLDPLVELCHRFKVVLIEDAAESLGSYYKGRHTGNLGRVSALSFNGNKIITTGGGGAILTNDGALGKQAKHLTTTAKVPHKWSFSHDQIGYNYRLPNINAALGCAQLEQMPSFLIAKRALAHAYRAAFASIEGARFQSEPGHGTSNYWLNALVLEHPLAGMRDDFLAASNEQGIMTRPAWTLMHELDMFKNCPRMDHLETAKNIERSLVNIPSSARLGDAFV